MWNILKKKKLNVIFIIMDGTRLDAIEKIPYYQELKKESVFFPKLITYAPYTLASLSSLFSGMYGYKNGVNGYYKSFSFDKENCFTLPQYLKESGYRTESDFLREDLIPSPGLDKQRIHDEFNEDLLVRHSEILTQIKNKKPFLLFLQHSKIHANIITNVAKKYSDFDEKYFGNKEQNFLTFVEWVDEGSKYLQGIIEKIKDLELYDNSLIFVLSDHGSSVGDRSGEKMYGTYLYDYTINCFLYMIGKEFPKNLEIKSIIRNIDILPTILDILKLKEKENYKKMQGKSFLPFIYEEEERVAYSETGGLGGPTPSPEVHNLQSVRTNKWKLIYNKTNDKKELYNLKEDPQENSNLIGKNPEIEERLWKELQKHN